MLLRLPEIQMTYFVIISLMTLVVAFLVPHHTKKIKDFIVSRRFLVVDGILISTHFLIQYFLHKNNDSLVTTRLLINLIFGFPSSYFLFMSLMYLLRRGSMSLSMWIFPPLLYVIALIFFSLSMFFDKEASVVLPYILFIWGVLVYYFGYMAISQFIRMKRKQRQGDHSGDLVLKWTQWSIFILSIVGFGYPLILIVNNVMARSVYGVLSLFSVFIYMLGMLGYSLNYNILVSLRKEDPLNVSPTVYDEEIAEEEEIIEDENKEVKEEKEESSSSSIEDNYIFNKVEKACEEFRLNKTFTHRGITIKEAANEMDISVTQLKNYLRLRQSTKFSTWIMLLRIEYSKEILINNPGMSNEQVAQQCGMCNRQYFQTQFLKYVGMTPSKWIKSRN